MGSKFAQASKYILQVGLKNHASYDQGGQKVNIEKFPFRIVF